MTGNMHKGAYLHEELVEDVLVHVLLQADGILDGPLGDHLPRLGVSAQLNLSIYKKI